MSIAHDDLAWKLATHLRGSSDRMVWTDMQLGPSGSCRPDVWTLNKSYSAPRPLAYEVKISKADYQRDVTAGKWQTYLPYSCAVVFAVPLGLITKTDLPKGCGLMVWNGQTWTTTKAPTLNPTPNLPRDLMMKLLIDGVDRASAHFRHEAKGAYAADRAIRNKFGKAVADVISEEANLPNRLAQVERRYREKERQESEAHQKRIKEMDAMVMGKFHGLCDALHLSRDCTPYVLRHRLTQAVDAVNGQVEVMALRRQLDDIRQTLKLTVTKVDHITTAAKMAAENELLAMC